MDTRLSLRQATIQFHWQKLLVNSVRIAGTIKKRDKKGEDYFRDDCKAIFTRNFHRVLLANVLTCWILKNRSVTVAYAVE